MKQHYIYQTTNLINNKKYIGKHYGELDDSYFGSGYMLQLAIKKYGAENFVKEILCISPDAQKNNENEKYYIKLFNAVESPEYYNIAPGGDGGDIFHCLSQGRQDIIKQKISQKTKGERNPMYGHHHSPETIKKLQQIDKSYMQTPEYRATMSRAVSGERNGMYGKHHTKDSKQKMSQAKKGKKAGKANGNAKSISAYKDPEWTDLIATFNTIQDALVFVGTKPTDYSGISRRMNLNKPYKGYYWKKECRD